MQRFNRFMVSLGSCVLWMWAMQAPWDWLPTFAVAQWLVMEVSYHQGLKDAGG